MHTVELGLLASMSKHVSNRLVLHFWITLVVFPFPTHTVVKPSPSVAHLRDPSSEVLWAL